MAVNLVALLDSGQELLVVVDLEIRMNAALHQDSSATESERFFDLLVNDVIGQDVSLRIPLHPIERAKRAELLADIRVVDVPIDDVADDIVRVAADTNPIRGLGQIEQVRLFKQAGSPLPELRVSPRLADSRIVRTSLIRTPATLRT